MVDAMSLYLDDSGTRNPDRNPADPLPSHGNDWFGLGGVLVRDSQRPAIEELHQSFCRTWGISYPLHSSEIRAKADCFKWLGKLPRSSLTSFYEGLTQLVTSGPLVAIACVVDRPGYNARYREKYGRERWMLCKTAFGVVVERAAKYARRHNCPLRVYVERSDRGTDNRMRRYYEELRTNGQPFDPRSSGRYLPLGPQELRETLYEFRTKEKSSRLIQLADLCLWPMCIGGYDSSNRSYLAMKNAGTLIDCRLPLEAAHREGIKYSCWELQEKKLQSPVGSNRALGQPSTTTSQAMP